LLKGAGLAAIPLAGPADAAANDGSGPGAAILQTMLERYMGFGIKASGGPGDEASGAWLAQELTAAGYACRRQPFDVPYFEVRQATLACGDAKATVVPQAIVAATGPQGLTAPLRMPSECSDLTGAIALLVLPFKRWAGLEDPQVAKPLADALQRGAAGAVLVTTGPTHEAIALNVSTHAPPIPKPVALLAPKDAAPFVAAARAGQSATLVLDGDGGGPARRRAWNLIARLDRGAARTLVISTPRSGWFTCAAERGSGLAVWLWLARWLARSRQPVNVELLATSGHEYVYVGGEHYLAEAAPPPAATAIWVHIGASAASRDWHEIGARLLPLPTPDAQRVLTATQDRLDATRRAFAGVSGLEATYLADKEMAGGELINVLNAGYASATGLYGIHRYFHTPADDLRCVSGDLVWPVAQAYRAAISGYLA
jgi:hypothetical protein